MAGQLQCGLNRAPIYSHDTYGVKIHMSSQNTEYVQYTQ